MSPRSSGPFGHDVELPEGVVLSVQEITKRPPRPPPQPPRWLARYLPGVMWSSAGEDFGDDDGEDGEDDLDDEPDIVARLSPFRPISFDVPAGGSLGIVGPDPGIRRAILWMIAGFIPPASGRIVVRGHVAPLFSSGWLNVTRQMGPYAVKLTARFLHWPWDLIRSRWDEIEEFARIQDITDYPPDSLEWEAHRTKRLLLSTVLHMDASVYLLTGNFYGSAPDFTERTHDLLEQKQREGCVIIQADQSIEEVGRRCHEAIYVDDGRALFRGRLGEVAKFAASRPVKRGPGMPVLPVRALLSDAGPADPGPGGRTIEIELDVFARRLDLALTMLLVDEAGRRLHIEPPEPFVADDPGIYRLRISIPGGELHDATYQARLLAAEHADGSDDSDEDGSPYELLAFELVSTNGKHVAPPAAIDVKLENVGWTVGRD